MTGSGVAKRQRFLNTTSSEPTRHSGGGRVIDVVTSGHAFSGSSNV